jgi:AraC-like DNA-binding protein
MAASFLDSNPTALGLLGLFDRIPGVIFYAKDRQSRYVAANAAMLEAKELADLSDLLGRTDRDFHPPVLADAYLAEDARVMESGEPLPGQIWFVLDRSGRPGWFNSSKVPLRDASGSVVGLAGIRYAVESPEDLERRFLQLAPVVRHLEVHYAAPVSMEAMARLAGMSSTHFNRRFTAVLGMSPTKFLHSLRVEKARHLLSRTDRAIAEIALDTGYHDQSHFTRHFRALTGVTPRAYRRRFWARGT